MAVAAAVLILAIIGIGFYAFKQKKRADQAIELHRPFGTYDDNLKMYLLSICRRFKIAFK